MKSESAASALRQAIRQATQFELGMAQTPYRMSSARTLNIDVPAIMRLPCAEIESELQNSEGATVFIIGYSEVGGDDVLAE